MSEPASELESRASDALGALGAFVLGLGITHLLWVQNPDMAPKLRGMILAGMTVVFLRVAEGFCREGKSGLPKAPATGRSVGILGVGAFFLALAEIGRADHLPPSSLTWFLISAVTLLAARGLGSPFLACGGAIWLHGTVTELVGLELGKTGGLVTDAIFVGLGVGAAMLLVGLKVFRRRGDVVGRALAGWGGFWMLCCLLLLSYFGDGYHGLVGRGWIPNAYYLGMILAGMVLARVAGLIRSNALSGMVVTMMCLRVLWTYFEMAPGWLPRWVLLIGAGAVLVTLSTLLEYLREGPTREAVEPPPGLTPAQRARALRVAEGLAFLTLAGGMLKGPVNGYLPAKARVAIRVEGRDLQRFLVPIIEPDRIDMPRTRPRPGARQTVWLQAAVVGCDDGACALLFDRMVPTPAGSPMPDSLDASRTIPVPARWIEARLFNGSPVRFPLARARWFWELPPGLRGKADWLEMKVGALGFVVPWGRG